ncbi:hypothetical protein [Desulfobacter curvatus]|uniref:hypothetical protein n=1 Tax=Desulfobacter curvatus TaxID=2290 RepID=UPI000361F24F|nr:hypothetical protein [Desulfobacter curvatus]
MTIGTTKQTETTSEDCMASKRTAQYLDAAEQTLNNWRHQGRGPSLYETLPSKKGIAFHWLYGFLFHNTFITVTN